MATPKTHTFDAVIVGAGGAGAVSTSNPGSDSVFNTFTSAGGGRGAANDLAPTSGGSGGGGRQDGSLTGGNSLSGTS